MTLGFPTTDFYCFQRRVLLNLWHLWGHIQTKSDGFYLSHQHEKSRKRISREGVGKCIPKNGPFQKCVVLFCFGLNIVKKKHDQERFGFDDAENF